MATDSPPDSDDSTPADGPALGVAVVAISNADGAAEDGPLGAVVAAVESAGYEIAIRERIGKSYDTVQSTVSRLAGRDDVDAILTTGGTSVEPDDETVGAVRPLLDAELPAFETLFTTRAVERVGTDVLSAHPLGGVIEGVPVFCFPGDASAVELAMEELVCPELERLVDLASPPDEDPNT